MSALLPMFVGAVSAMLAGQPIGYGQMATGAGNSGTVCHVTDQASLASCVSGTAPATVVFDVPNLEIDSPDTGSTNLAIQVGSNKTILGPVQISTNGTAFELLDAQNDIIQGITFRNDLSGKCSGFAAPANFPMLPPSAVVYCGVIIDIIGASNTLWIDHNTFHNCGRCFEIFSGPRGDLGDDGRYRVPDRITISNNLIADSYMGIAVSWETSIPAAQQPQKPERVTFYGNLWRDDFRRTPRGVHANVQIHEFNDAVVDFGGAGPCGGGFAQDPVDGAQVLIENTYFEAWPSEAGCKIPIAPYLGGQWSATGSATVNGALINSGSATPLFAPPYAYSMIDATDVPQLVLHAGAGP